MRRWLLGGLVALVLMAAGEGEVRAQTRADSAAVLLNAAEQLRLQGETAAARALLALIERQYGGTPAATEVARMRTLLRRTPDAERPGRTELLVFGGTYGAWLGIATPLAFGSDSPESFGLGLLLGAPIGFFAARSYADTYAPTEGQARAITFGGGWGTVQGFLLAEILDLGEETYCEPPEFGGFCYESESGDGSEMFAAALAGGLAGIATGAMLARKPITAGTAAAVSASGPWGTWFGIALGVLADQENDGLLTAAVLGGNAALVTTGLLAPSWQISESRVRLISLAGLVGGLGGAGLVLLMQPDDDKTAIAIPLVTSVAGLVAGARWTREHDVGAGDRDGGADALLQRDARSWSLALPAPALHVRRDAARARAGVYVPLFSARF